MRFLFEITAKMETLRLDGVTQYGTQGRLTIEIEGIDTDTEPLTMGLRLSEELWESVKPGDVLAFDMLPEIHRPSAATN